MGKKVLFVMSEEDAKLVDKIRFNEPLNFGLKLSGFADDTFFYCHIGNHVIAQVKLSECIEYSKEAQYAYIVLPYACTSLLADTRFKEVNISYNMFENCLALI